MKRSRYGARVSPSTALPSRSKRMMSARVTCAGARLRESRKRSARLRIAHADVAEAIDDLLLREDAIGDDERVDELRVGFDGRHMYSFVESHATLCADSGYRRSREGGNLVSLDVRRSVPAFAGRTGVLRKTTFALQSSTARKNERQASVSSRHRPSTFCTGRSEKLNSTESSAASCRTLTHDGTTKISRGPHSNVRSPTTLRPFPSATQNTVPSVDR